MMINAWIPKDMLINMLYGNIVKLQDRLYPNFEAVEHRDKLQDTLGIKTGPHLFR